MTGVSKSRASQDRVISKRSIALIFFAWFILQFLGIFSPGLLDDVDSIYIQIAREMLARHDFVTPTIDGIRFFDKPPLMYWLAAGSMSIFGIKDWAARLPLALGTLGLFYAVYGLGIRLFRAACLPEAPDRGGLYAALALATSIGPYLYTRFYIPDILVALWMTLAVHLTLASIDSVRRGRSALWPTLAFAAVLALNLLTKGFVGLFFSVSFVLLYLALTRDLHLLPKLPLARGFLLFLAVAGPWHILAAIRNPAIPMPSGVGLPLRAGWAWFYLYNEHIARFLARRIPHDYGITPIWLFWLYVVVWAMPYAAFLPAALAAQVRAFRRQAPTYAPLALPLWSAIVLGFFTVSNRQEYYSLPALPALALAVAGLLAHAELPGNEGDRARRSVSVWTTRFLLPLTTVIAAVCGFLAVTSPSPPPGTTLFDLLAGNQALYNVSLGHLFDLTGAAMSFFRGPLAAVAVGMLLVGLGSTALRHRGEHYAAVLAMAAGMTVTLLGAHAALVRFNPILGSKSIAEAINQVRQPDDLIFTDGELTYGSSLLFYTGQPLHLVNGHFNGPWFGSFWPDAPAIFETDDSLHQAWSSPRRLFLMTYNTQRIPDLQRFGTVSVLLRSGGKTLLSNRP